MRDLSRLKVAATAVTATLLLAGCAVQTEPSPAVTYTAVIDAGSSGSRIYLYQGETFAADIKVQTLLEFQPDESKGLSSFIENPGGVGEGAIEPLLHELGQFLEIRNIKHEDVPVYVLATAGMRNVEAANPVAAQEIYSDVAQTITADGYSSPEITTISGKREAIYSWTDINYDAGVFSGTTAPQGIVEVGGASSQIAFPTTSAGANVVDLTIAGEDYSIFGVSYLGMGQNDARAGVLNPSDSVSGNPCFPNNASGTEPVSYDINNPVSVNATQSIFDFESCEKLYANYLAAAGVSEFNSAQTAGISPTEVSLVPGFEQTDFYGLAALNFSLKDFDAASSEDEAAAMHSSVTALCAGQDTWPAVKNNFGGKVSQYSENGCANGVYNYTWAFSTAGLHVSPEQLTAAGKIRGTTLTWTRGFVVLLLTGNTVN